MAGLVGSPGNISLGIIGTDGNVSIQSKDPFCAFKAQLQAFTDFLRTGEPPRPFSETLELMRVLIAGIESRDRGGELIRVRKISTTN